MVFDSLSNAHLYYGLGEGIRAALEFFATYDASSHEGTPLTIGGPAPGITVNRAAYTTGPAANPLLEAHRAFIDVMFVAEGEEALYVQPLDTVHIAKPYDPSIEAALGPLDAQSAARFHFRAGQFAILFPDDAHCPGQLWNNPSAVKKLVAKVPVSG